MLFPFFSRFFYSSFEKLSSSSYCYSLCFLVFLPLKSCFPFLISSFFCFFSYFFEKLSFFDVIFFLFSFSTYYRYFLSFLFLLPLKNCLPLLISSSKTYLPQLLFFVFFVFLPQKLSESVFVAQWLACLPQNPRAQVRIPVRVRNRRVAASWSVPGGRYTRGGKPCDVTRPAPGEGSPGTRQGYGDAHRRHARPETRQYILNL